MKFIITSILLISFACCTSQQEIANERNNPKTFLDADMTEWKGSTEATGSISNQSRYTDYGTITLLFSYYSEDGILLGTERKDFMK
jgi:hypothetical protein